MKKLKFEIVLEVGSDACGDEKFVPTPAEVKEYLLHCVTKNNPYDATRYLNNAQVTWKRGGSYA